jgi:hypothetical protein
MLHPIDRYSAGGIVYVIKNAVDSYTQAVIGGPTKFFRAWWAGIFCQSIDVLADKTSIILW